MDFDKKTHKVKWWLMNKDEARAFLLFLESERKRHLTDVEDIDILVVKVVKHYNLEAGDLIG